MWEQCQSEMGGLEVNWKDDLNLETMTEIA